MERTKVFHRARWIWLLCAAGMFALAGSKVTTQDRNHDRKEDRNHDYGHDRKDDRNRNRDHDRKDDRNHGHDRDHDSDRKGRSSFVTREGSDLYLQGRLFRFAGSNNYYPIYKSPLMVTALLDKAAVSDFAVMRVWSTVVIGNQDGSNSVDGIKEGVYFHYWDGAAPAFNDGPDGLQRLDFVVAEAAKRKIKLVLPLVNNWNEFGGMNQYVRWRGGQYHDEFYTDATIKGWYKEWISHLLNRKNSITGLRYKDDPTIMMWELANEPRCIGSGGANGYPRSPNCTTDTLVSWAGEMSKYIKSIDKHHLVSVGDDGFLCLPNGTDWTDNCSEGVDSYAFAALPHIDAMSLHLYPDADSWGKTPEWGTDWIVKHTLKAKKLRKVVYLGEFGTKSKDIRNPVYFEWTRVLFYSGANGGLYWILSDVEDNGAPYPDYDRLTVYCPSPVCTTMSNFSARMATGRILGFPPVADDDAAEGAFDSSVTLTPTSNDVGYLGRRPVPSTIDLDPSSNGQQTMLTSAAGTFLLANGDVTFTPVAGFQGDAQASYTVRDTSGRKSNVAQLRAKILPDPNGAILLYSFENDAQGWAAASWQTDAGTTARVTDFATQGAASLQVTATGGGWFGLNVAEEVLDISGKTQFKYDLRTLASGTSVNIAIQDRNWLWCEGSWGWQDPGTTATLVFDLASLTGNGAPCDVANFSDVNAIWVNVGAGASVNIDNVRAE
jgi:mannan endo-1,4-beta-mannosidase